MKVTFLGTGTSQGVPLIGCQCEVCQSPSALDKRLRSSIHIENKGQSLVIDSGPDFRQQMLRADIRRLDGLVFTHGHKDHTAGFDDIRAFNFIQQEKINVYASLETQETLKREFAYVFAEHKYPGIPEINLFTIGNAPFDIGPTHFIPVEVLHYRLPVLGFRVGNFTYITDANAISDKEIAKLAGTDVLVLNALRKEKHISHFSLDEAMAMARRINARVTYFTHISHQMGLHAQVEASLPEGMHLAYDGLVIDIN